MNGAFDAAQAKGFVQISNRSIAFNFHERQQAAICN
jgi:uncharacterized membrane protein